MSRATLIYILMLVICAAGVWAIIRAGQRLQAPTDLSGLWYVGGEDPAVPEHLGETVDVEQSGKFFRLNFSRGLRVDVRLAEPPDKPEAGENLDLIFEGPQWKLAAFGASADGPLIFRLMGPERHTFTVTRRAAGSDDEPKAEAASASLPAETAEAAVGTDAP